MKRFLIPVIAVLWLFPCLSAAQKAAGDQPTREEVRELTKQMRLDQQLMSLREVTKGQMHEVTRGLVAQYLPNASTQERARVDKFLDDYHKKMMAAMPLEQALDAVVPAYQRNLTRADVKQMIQFYSSPVAQRFLDRSPAIMAEASQAQDPIVRKWMHDYLMAVQTEAANLCRDLAGKRPKAQSTK